METVYLLCFLVGLFFSILSAVFSGVFGGDGVDTGDTAFGGGWGTDGGVDAPIGTDIDVAHSFDSGDLSPGTVHFSPVSPVTLSMFVTSFGGVGLVGVHLFDLDPVQHILLAVSAGFVCAGITFYVFYQVFKQTQASSEVVVERLIGKSATVSVTIPESGVGEITYVARGSRYTAPARGEGERGVPRSTEVTIRRTDGATFVVEPRSPATKSGLTVEN